MRSLHPHLQLRRRTAALALAPALLAAGALQDRPSAVPAAGPASVTTSLSRSTDVPAVPRVRHEPAPLEAMETLGTAGHRPTGPRAVEQRQPGVQDRGRAALAWLRYDWRALGYEVRFRPYDGRALGTANRRTRLITVYVRPGQSELSLRVSLAHELGHALDFEHGTTQRRDAYRRLRGLPSSSPWFPCDRCDDLASPAGDFAEVFALWLVGPGDFRSRLKGPPDRQQLADLAGLFVLPRAASASPTPAPTPEAGPDEPREDDSVVAAVLDPLESPPPGV